MCAFGSVLAGIFSRAGDTTTKRAVDVRIWYRMAYKMKNTRFGRGVVKY